MKTKLKKLLLILPLLLFVAVSTTSCGDDKKDEPNDGNQTSISEKAKALIGSWTSGSDYEIITYTFRGDGTGTETVLYYGERTSESFRWSATDYTLTLKFEDGDIMEDSYTIEGRTLYFCDEVFYKN